MRYYWVSFNKKHEIEGVIDNGSQYMDEPRVYEPGPYGEILFNVHEATPALMRELSGNAFDFCLDATDELDAYRQAMEFATKWRLM